LAGAQGPPGSPWSNGGRAAAPNPWADQGQKAPGLGLQLPWRRPKEKLRVRNRCPMQLCATGCYDNPRPDRGILNANACWDRSALGHFRLRRGAIPKKCRQGNHGLATISGLPNDWLSQRLVRCVSGVRFIRGAMLPLWGTCRLAGRGNSEAVFKLGCPCQSHSRTTRC